MARVGAGANGVRGTDDGKGASHAGCAQNDAKTGGGRRRGKSRLSRRQTFNPCAPRTFNKYRFFDIFKIIKLKWVKNFQSQLKACVQTKN